MAQNVVLTGFMGAGKTTVGRLLAESLGWRFIDLDDEIVSAAGMSIPDLFRTRGEAVFRALESRLTAALSSVHHAVMAPGGGWIMDPANTERLPPGSCTVWLRVSAAEAVRRLREARSSRPLLEGADDPVARAEALMAARSERYRTADIVIDVDGREPAAIVEEIRSHIRFEE